MLFRSSRELGKKVELAGYVGGIIRQDPDLFDVSNGIRWGFGAALPTRTPLRLLAEADGEMRTSDATTLSGVFQARDGSLLFPTSRAHDPLQLRVGPVWQDKRGFFVHGGLSYSRRSGDRNVAGTTVPHTGLAMTVDIGDARDIHPRNKQEAGRRLSLVARKLVYGETNLVHSGPEFTEMQIEPPKGDRIRLYFKNLGGGLRIKPGDDKLKGFVVAGPDKEWVWADAVIEGDTILISSPDVPTPKYVRYGWAWNPIGNLYNAAGLPAITFRTDE